MELLRELWAALVDAAECGDLAGHLRAWWEVVRGDVAQVTGLTVWGRLQVGKAHHATMIKEYLGE